MAEQASWQRELAQLRERVESLAVRQVRLEQSMDTLVATVAENQKVWTTPELEAALLLERNQEREAQQEDRAQKQGVRY